MTKRARVPLPTLPGDLILAAGYKRCSSKEQIEGYGLDVQDDAIRSWESEATNRKLVAMFSDEGVSGELETRPDMAKLEAFAETGRINRIVVPRVDRIGRTARASYLWAWRMQDVGVHFIAIQERIDTSDPLGWTMFQQYVFFSELEWNKIRERTQAGREKKITFGGWPGGPAPWGYRIEGVGKKGSYLVVCESEAMILLRAVDLIADEGMNIPEAADELNRLGLLTRSGKPWTPENLYTRLHSETLDGYTTYRKTNRGDRKNATKLYEDGTPVYGEPIRIGVPRIIPEERLKLLREAMAKTATGPRREADRVYPLSGRLRGLCGHSYVGAGRALENSYRCNGNKKNNRRRGGCEDPYLPAAEMEAAVWGEVSRLLRDRERLEAMASDWVKSLPGNVEKFRERERRLSKEIETQRTLIDARVPEYIKAGMNPVVAAAAVKTLTDELDKLILQRDEVCQWLAGHDEAHAQIEKIASLSEKARDRLDSMSLAEKAEIFRMFNIQVAVKPGFRPRTGGSRCETTEWHRETGTLIPPDVTADEWGAVAAILVERHTEAHLTRSKIDVRMALNGVLHKLRTGVSWEQMPTNYGPPQRIRARLLTWWRGGTWPLLMEHLGAKGRGTPVPERRIIPGLIVTGELRRGLLVSLESGAAAEGGGEPPSGDPVPDASIETGLESPDGVGAALPFSLTTA